MTRNTFLISFIVLVTNTIGISQNKLDSYFDHLFENRKMMGSVSISFQDSIIYSKSIGYSNAETKKLIDQNTKIRFGSITKTFTAVLLLKAMEDGLITLDDKLNSFYPQVKNAEKITIEYLLKHRSGIVNFTEIPGENEWEQAFHTEQEFMNFFVNEKSNFEPNTDYQYSNTNYALLGFILQKIYGKPFSVILDEKICQPLHLKNTYFSNETDETKNEALSYNIQNKYIQNAKVNFSNHPASGGLVSTAIELNIFLSALFSGKLISEASLALMLPKVKGEYGLGIERLTFDNPDGYTHGGRIENYFSEYWYFPKEKLGIVTLANAINIRTDDIQTTLTQYAYRTPPTLANFNKTEELSEVEFKKIAGTYIEKEQGYTIFISSDGRTMIFQSALSGQMYIPLRYIENTIFEYRDEIKFEFFPNKGELKLTQGGITQYYEKQT